MFLRDSYHSDETVHRTVLRHEGVRENMSERDGAVRGSRIRESFISHIGRKRTQAFQLRAGLYDTQILCNDADFCNGGTGVAPPQGETSSNYDLSFVSDPSGVSCFNALFAIVVVLVLKVLYPS